MPVMGIAPGFAVNYVMDRILRIMVFATIFIQRKSGIDVLVNAMRKVKKTIFFYYKQQKKQKASHQTNQKQSLFLYKWYQKHNS